MSDTLAGVTSLGSEATLYAKMALLPPNLPPTPPSSARARACLSPRTCNGFEYYACGDQRQPAPPNNMGRSVRIVSDAGHWVSCLISPTASGECSAGGETLREHGKAQARYMRFPRCSQPNPQSTQWRRLIGSSAAGMPTAQQSHDDRPRAPSAHLPHLRAHWGGSVEQKRYSGGRDARY